MGAAQLLAGVSALAFVGSGTVIGFRLIRLARRTKGFPERVLGLSLFVLAAVAWPGMLVVGAPTAPPAPVLRAALAAAGIAMALGWSGQFFFTWRVFRPTDRWARVLAGAGVGLELGAGLAAAARALTIDDAMALRTPVLQGTLLLTGAQVAYAWGAFEASRYRALLRRRIPLGLADPLVANRFGLWGWAGTFAAGAIAPSTVSVLMGSNPHTPLNHLVIAVCGLASSGALLLAFLPPAAYVRFVRESAPDAPDVVGGA